jgi:predicted glycoside hydrolase/deacetylase ChbG (UPF0249 family)
MTLPAERTLIVNADDFGRSPGINRGIIEAHERGIVTSASLMVHWPAAVEAAKYAREHSSLSVGLHLDLGEWVLRGDEWVPDYQRADVEDSGDVEREVQVQLALFRELTGADPSHIDSHQHVHLRETVLPVVIGSARRLGKPVRGQTRGIHYCGYFYGQMAAGQAFPEGISVQNLVQLLSTLKPGVTELACHPGYAIDFETVYREERAVEVATLCHQDIHAAIRAGQIQLRSFRQLLEQNGSPQLIEESRLEQIGLG